jgi:hypothetical protein
MAQTAIPTITMESHEATYKTCSTAAAAFTRALVKMKQMRPDDIRQRPADRKHIDTLKKSMGEEGARRGQDLHAYLDIKDPLWGDRSYDETMELIKCINAQNRVEGGTATISVLPEDIPVRITTGLHRLYAYSGYLVENWSTIKNPKPPLESVHKECPFADGLRKPAAEILAQDEASWIVTIEYIRK